MVLFAITLLCCFGVFGDHEGMSVEEGESCSIVTCFGSDECVGYADEHEWFVVDVPQECSVDGAGEPIGEFDFVFEEEGAVFEDEVVAEQEAGALQCSVGIVEPDCLLVGCSSDALDGSALQCGEVHVCEGGADLADAFVDLELIGG